MSTWNDNMKLRAAYGIDYDHIGSFLFSTSAPPADPESLIPEIDLNNYPEAPPPVANYHAADVAGLGCWNCGHFTCVGDPDNDGIPDGLCELWETQADGNCTCDRFTAHADLLRQGPHTSWKEDQNAQDLQDVQDAMRASIAQYDYSDHAVLHELNFTGDAATEEDGLIWKEILRTGEWKQTPTNKGIVNKKLMIVKDGKTDPQAGVLSLSEIYTNFNDGAVPYVTVPLSDDESDHKNIARVNTGFVRKLKLVDRDGVSYLVAGIDFTEPEVKGKVLRGTIPDCSAGVPYGVVRRSDNRVFGSVLDHVCLTRRPYIDRLAPFGIAASDSDNPSSEMPVEAWEVDEVPSEQTPPSPTIPQSESAPGGPPTSLSYRTMETEIRNAMGGQLQLATADYQVVDIEPDPAVCIIQHTSGTSWRVPFRVTEDAENRIRLATVNFWKEIEQAEEAPSEPVAVAASDPIQQAHQLRELRLAQPNHDEGSIQMSTLSLDGVELSDADRARIQSILDENATLKRTNRETDADKRISELEALGLRDRPGALKLYRQIMLSDDGGPAIILFSDSDDESKKERLTALQILDRFLAALQGDGGVTFSDQALQSGNDVRPPATPDGENKALDDRVKEANKALYGNEEGTVRRRRRPVKN